MVLTVQGYLKDLRFFLAKELLLLGFYKLLRRI